MNGPFTPKAPDARVGEIIKLAVMAVGGQGGGVLTGWIETLARAQGYACQATSVAGVAQRTGSTIYYLELTPASDQEPVFALAPSSGDVDILIAAEMMEVGRAIMRGFVTPDRTVLIGSTHRALAVSEKTVPGDGIADIEQVRAAAEIAAKELILADMEQLAVNQGSVISSSLFGALAASGSLPFEREAFEDAIRCGGRAVDTSLRAFAAGYDAALNGEGVDAEAVIEAETELVGPKKELDKWRFLATRAKSLPEPVQEIAQLGLQKVIDFQDCAYGKLYLDRLESVVSQDSPDMNWELSCTAAKYIANAMAYDDVIRVADLKTRAPRFTRIQAEMGTNEANLLELTEFFHPRAEEIAGMMPAKMGAKWEADPKRMKLLDRLFNKGRRLRTHRLTSFLVLHVIGGLKKYRLKTRRHEVEVAHLEAWLSKSLAPLQDNYMLSVELLRNRRLIKGYSDTHARGLSKFDRVMSSSDLLKGREDASEWIRRLREAALKDPQGEALDGAIKTIKSFA